MLKTTPIVNPFTPSDPAPEPVSGVILALALGSLVAAGVLAAGTTVVAAESVVLGAADVKSLIDDESEAVLVATSVVVASVSEDARLELVTVSVLEAVVAVDSALLLALVVAAGAVVFCTENQFAATGWPNPAALANPSMSKFKRFERSLLSVKALS